MEDIDQEDQYPVCLFYFNFYRILIIINNKNNKKN